MAPGQASQGPDLRFRAEPSALYLGSSGAMPSDHPKDTKEEAAHDVLAAEAFAVPGPDPSLRQRQVVLPDDPSGIAQPHDVLAAEEFAMPAASPRARTPASPGAVHARRTVAGAVAGLLALVGLRRARR